MGADSIINDRKHFYHWIKPRQKRSPEIQRNQYDEFFTHQIDQIQPDSNDVFITSSVTNRFEGDYFACVRCPINPYGFYVQFNDDRRLSYPLEMGVEIEKRFDRFTIYRSPIQTVSGGLLHPRISDRYMVCYASRGGIRYRVPPFTSRRSTMTPVSYRVTIAAGNTHLVMGTAGGVGIMDPSVMPGKQLADARAGWLTILIVNRGPGNLEFRGDEISQPGFGIIEPDESFEIRAFDIQQSGSIFIAAVGSPCTVDIFRVQ